MIISHLYIATPCNHRQPLLDRNSIDLEVPFYLHDDRITSSSSFPNYIPSEARMSGDGWCAESMCAVGSERQYLQVDFGAKLIVQAISIGNVNGSFHVSRYFIEYGSDANYFESDRTQLYCGDPDSVSFDKTTAMHKKLKLGIYSKLQQ